MTRNDEAQQQRSIGAIIDDLTGVTTHEALRSVQAARSDPEVTWAGSGQALLDPRRCGGDVA